MAKQRSFPRRTLEQALRVPNAIKEHNNGNPWKTEEVAKALRIGANGSNFFYITAASRDYGLTSGTRETAEIRLEPLGREAVYPASPEEERRARIKAFSNVEAFEKVLQHYGGNNLPDREFLSNTLVDTFNIAVEHHDEFVEMFTKNCQFLNIGKSFDIAEALTGTPSRRISVGPSVETEEPATITVATPEGADDAPVCFVIMPFTERDDDHAPGFFKEALQQLLIPAATAAGFEVKTAHRSGSDIIQATIVNDLLEADMVLCDLTEHNPNVLFELGMRISEEKPVTLVKAIGTGRIFDVDHLYRVVEYDPNLWPSTVEIDLPVIQDHISATWDNRETGRTYLQILRDQSPR